jgi:hypothetical protein
MTTFELPESTFLQPGQALRMAVDPGFRLMVTQGCVTVLSPPSWMGESMFNAKAMLCEGEVYTVERGGWIELAAASSAQIAPLPQPVTSRSIGSRVARLVQLLTGQVAWR